MLQFEALVKENMPSLTKTVVFTDLAGYTQKTATIGHEELQKLAEAHEQHVLEVFKPFGGQLVKSIGDSYMAVFDSATDGVKACLELVQTTLPGMGMGFVPLWCWGRAAVGK